MPQLYRSDSWPSLKRAARVHAAWSANRAAAMERITEAGAVFETDHRGCSAMEHHRHGSSFVTLVLGGAYVEVCDMVPALCGSGSIVVHDAAEEHADRFASDTRCLNVELPPESECRRACVGASSCDSFQLQNAVGEVVRSFYADGRELGAAVARLQDALLAPVRRGSAGASALAAQRDRRRFPGRRPFRYARPLRLRVCTRRISAARSDATSA